MVAGDAPRRKRRRAPARAVVWSLYALVVFWRSRQRSEVARRRAFIEEFIFPRALGDRLVEHGVAAAGSAEALRVLDGLRLWFLCCLHAGGQQIGMPSRAVDRAWHEFILMTREYHAFCDEAFGRYLHHAPEATMSTPMDEALGRTLRIIEKHDLGRTGVIAGVPILFSLDAELGRDDAALWDGDRVERLRRPSGDGGSSGGGDGGGGDGGGGCGGGCGGG